MTKPERPRVDPETISSELQLLRAGAITLDEFLEMKLEAELRKFGGRLTASLREQVAAAFKERMREDLLLKLYAERARDAKL